ncbi:hypothetical protein [Novosphingobium mangrovi (ex Huang et al. 2023)]|uniref:Uncharacterized protein n=1 Tax=Novosphingobium mangrovi (ex Huang et al. 2023) TaxID=2976432 RepID=A0ABT2IAJ7_9SPHN|nr:hypothetical protein [Novosphingobium mangrovi (ex Huang et al. 2023)]MCT2401849.1 hypothetical protein [Novosphingobium mangrovi (ex Huang et al. 2023)]
MNMPMPVGMRGRPSFEKEGDLAAEDNYWFTYTNSTGELVRLFKDSIIFELKGGSIAISVKSILSICCQNPTKMDPKNNKICIYCCDGEVEYYADTEFDGGHDVFLLAGALNRLKTIYGKK